MFSEITKLEIVKNDYLPKETTLNSNISCNLCDLIFKSGSELDKHTEEKHPDNVENEKEVESIVISER